MTCRPCLAGSSEAARNMVRCLRASLGAAPSDRWDEDAHRALYDGLSRQIDIRTPRGMTAEAFRAIPFSSEPQATAQYAASYANRYLLAHDRFWTCIGTAQTDAELQQKAGAGPYWDVLTDVTQHVYNTEARIEEKPGGIPTPVLVVGGLALVGLIAWALWE